MSGRAQVEGGPAASMEGRSYAEGGGYVAGHWEAGEEQDWFIIIADLRAHGEYYGGRWFWL